MNPLDPLEDFDAYSSDVSRATAQANRKKAMNDAACQMIGVVAGMHAQIEMARLGCLLNPNLSQEALRNVLGLPIKHKWISLSGEELKGPPYN